jgi:AP2-associated kinase
MHVFTGSLQALGILLYIMCFYTSPFPNGNKLGILNGKYQIPASPSYPAPLLSLIGTDVRFIGATTVLTLFRALPATESKWETNYLHYRFWIMPTVPSQMSHWERNYTSLDLYLTSWHARRRYMTKVVRTQGAVVMRI